MIFAILRFWIPLLLVCMYAARRGGAPERAVAAMLMVAGLVTILTETTMALRYTSLEVDVMLTDLALLGALVVLALKANRWWPMFLCSLQAMTVLGHIGKMFDPEILRLAYAIMLFAPAYPGLLVLAIGTYRHRARLRQRGVDVSWSS